MASQFTQNNRKGVNIMKNFGLTDERYTQMKNYGYDDEDIEEIVEEWGIDQTNDGYGIFDFDGTGLLELEAIGEIAAFECDDAAVVVAIENGMKFIPVAELPVNFDRRYLGWLDTPENRAAIKRYCDADNYYCNGNSIRN